MAANSSLLSPPGLDFNQIVTLHTFAYGATCIQRMKSLETQLSCCNLGHIWTVSSRIPHKFNRGLPRDCIADPFFPLSDPSISCLYKSHSCKPFHINFLCLCDNWYRKWQKKANNIMGLWNWVTWDSIPMERSSSISAGFTFADSTNQGSKILKKIAFVLDICRIFSCDYSLNKTQ